MVVTLVVLLVLTLLAIGSTSSNRLQTVMATNNQFQLEAWNSSYVELTSRMRAINATPVTDGIPDYVRNLAETGDEKIFTPLNVLSANTSSNTNVEAGIRLVRTECLDEATGSSVGIIGTNDVILSSRTNLLTAGQSADQVGISSDQRQRIGINFTFGQKGVCTPEEEVADDVDIPTPGSI